MRVNLVYIKKATKENSEILVTRFNSFKHNKSMGRLIDYLKNKDPNCYKLLDTGVILKRLIKGAKFNTSFEVLIRKEGFPKKGKEFRLKAIRRLAHYLEKRNPEYIYTSSYDFKRIMGNTYSICSTQVDVFSNNEKVKIIKSKIRGQKATLTKTINETKKLRDSYKETLFPNDYRTDPLYVKNIDKIKKKREKLKAVKQLKAEDINTFSNNRLNEKQKSDVLKYLKKNNFKFCA